MRKILVFALFIGILLSLKVFAIEEIINNNEQELEFNGKIEYEISNGKFNIFIEEIKNINSARADNVTIVASIYDKNLPSNGIMYKPTILFEKKIGSLEGGASLVDIKFNKDLSTLSFGKGLRGNMIIAIGYKVKNDIFMVGGVNFSDEIILTKNNYKKVSYYDTYYLQDLITKGRSAKARLPENSPTQEMSNSRRSRNCKSLYSSCTDQCFESAKSARDKMSQNTAHAIGTAAAGAIAGFGLNNRSAGLDMLSDADSQFDDNASSYQDIQAYEDQCEQQCEMQKSNCLNN